MNDELAYLPLAHLRVVNQYVETIAEGLDSDQPLDTLPIGIMLRGPQAPWIELDVGGRELLIARRSFIVPAIDSQPIPAMAAFPLEADGRIIPRPMQAMASSAALRSVQ